VVAAVRSGFADHHADARSMLRRGLGYSTPSLRGVLTIANIRSGLPATRALLDTHARKRRLSRGDLDEKAATIRMGIRRRGGGMMLGA